MSLSKERCCHVDINLEHKTIYRVTKLEIKVRRTSSRASSASGHRRVGRGKRKEKGFSVFIRPTVRVPHWSKYSVAAASADVLAKYVSSID